jgi:hypothetical protein
MSVEQNCNPSNIRRRKDEDIVISIGIKDGDDRIVFLSNSQTQPQIENPNINTIPPVNTEMLFGEKELPSLNLPKVSHSKKYTLKEDKVIDIGFLDKDGNIIRLSNNQS